MKELIIELKKTTKEAFIKLCKALFILLVLIPAKLMKMAVRRLYTFVKGNPKRVCLLVCILSFGFVIANTINCACKVKDTEHAYDSIMFVNDSLQNYSRYESGYNAGYKAKHYRKL